MVKLDRIHRTKTPRRPHFIPEWAKLRGMSQADLARELGADKSVVSRWWSGTAPGVEWQASLAALFFGDEEDAERLFRHPDDDWLTHFFRNRDRDEIERIKKSLEAGFPLRTAKR